MSQLAIRPMTVADLATALDWAAAEGWNPGLDDAAAFHAADPGGFLMGFLGDAPAACISVVAYGDAYGFLCLYICRPEFRGQGHGWALWQAGIARLGARTIGLDGVVAQQANYAKSGFVLAFRNIRYGGTARAHETADPRLVELRPNGQPPGLAGSVAAFDRACVPGPRENFLRAWLTPPGRRVLAFVEGNAVRGYGAVRACREGHKIGPLFAETPAIADLVFSALTARLHGAPIFLDLPEPNPAATAMAERHGLAPVFETARMYRGPAPALPLERIYGITTLELG
ncbi:GNAT family N-acetyltransferase [soil metagenome]